MSQACSELCTFHLGQGVRCPLWTWTGHEMKCLSGSQVSHCLRTRWTAPRPLASLVQVGRSPAEVATEAAHCWPQPLDRLCLQVGGLDLMGKEMWGAGQRGGPSLPCSPSRWQPLRGHSRGSGRRPGAQILAPPQPKPVWAGEPLKDYQAFPP